MKSKSTGLQSLMQAFSNAISLSLFSLVKSLVALGGKKGVGWLIWRRQVCLGRRGMLYFYSPAHIGHVRYHTGHVRYSRAGPNYSKMCFVSSNPFLCCCSVQKVYDLDPNRVLLLFLSNAINLFSLFQINGIIKNLLA